MHRGQPARADHHSASASASAVDQHAAVVLGLADSSDAAWLGADRCSTNVDGRTRAGREAAAHPGSADRRRQHSPGGALLERAGDRRRSLHDVIAATSLDPEHLDAWAHGLAVRCVVFALDHWAPSPTRTVGTTGAACWPTPSRLWHLRDSVADLAWPGQLAAPDGYDLLRVALGHRLPHAEHLRAPPPVARFYAPGELPADGRVRVPPRASHHDHAGAGTARGSGAPPTTWRCGWPGWPHPLCCLCAAPATVPDHHPLSRRELVAAGDSHPDAWRHLRPLCEACHNAKSARDRR